MLKSNNPFIFFLDLETTGFSPVKNDAIQLAALVAKKEGDEYIKLDTINEFMRPNCRETWTEGAERIHKISLAEALTFQHPRDALVKLLNFLVPYKHENNEPLLFVDHSMRMFDYKFLLNAFMKEGLEQSFAKVFNPQHYESTVTIANTYKPATGLQNSKLGTVAEYFKIELDHHEASSDVNACFEIYKQFKKMKLGLGFFDDD